MKAPLSWLKQYVDIPQEITPQQIQQMITMRGIEISNIQQQGEEISNVVVGQILAIEKHPDAQKLVVCQISVSKEVPIQIVTGADNIAVGDKIPVALVGATLPKGIKIKKGKLRGIESSGMLCSGEELGVSEEQYQGAGVDGIMILKPDCSIGEDIKKTLKLDDVVFEAEPTPNRPDCLSIIGVAREVAAAIGKKISLPQINESALSQNNEAVTIDIQDTSLCGCYIAKLVKNIKIQPSPKWMVDALGSAGVRSINNIVDITNFVMLETGQPIHAFDFSCISGQKIVVRTAKDKEKIVTLDNKTHTLTADMLVIADESKPIALAGIMGGENSEITQNTKQALFEFAKFNGANVRKSAKALSISSEAAQRFSKGIDIEMVSFACKRVCQLIAQLDAGEVVEGASVSQSESEKRKTITVDSAKINARIALNVSPNEMCDILNSLDIPTKIENNLLVVEIPHFRDDISLMEDISEEIARVYGYDKIPETLMRGDLMRGKFSPKQQMQQNIRKTLTALGAYEAITYSFTSPKVFDSLGLDQNDELRSCVGIFNPFGEDNSLLRSTLLIGMVNVLSTNFSKKTASARFFEMGVVHRLAKNQNELPDEQEMLCIGVYGANEDFFTLKGMIETIFSQLGKKTPRFEIGGKPYYHSGRKANIILGNECVGEIGQIDAKVCENFGLAKNTYIAQIKISALLKCIDDVVKYKVIARFPVVNRDIAFVVSSQISAESISKTILSKGGPLLKSVELFDVYQGENIEQGSKSMAFALKFNSDEKTLVDAQVNEAIEKIVSALEKQYNVQIRK